ncbi:MAG: autotransporter domain-containing protein [Pseudorhodoplanes sp.]|nr:autotransporter domain-containing protein [Pseudorhodoplanes sp.]
MAGLGLAAAVGFVLANSAAFAQLTPSPTIGAGTMNAALSAPGAIFDLGSKFLRDNANQANATVFGPAAGNPGGGGADLAVNGEQPAVRYRIWGEAYGTHARTSAQNAFTGDTRKTYGGILGLGATVAPGVSFGVSVDQGHSKIDIRDLPQSSRIDLTQIGANAIFESGPWTFTAAGIYGFGDIAMRRTDAGGEISADYDASLWGAIAETSYYWQSGNWRVVPRIGIDWTQIKVDAFTESGGATPVTATAQQTRRLRAFAGVEVGYSWLAGAYLHDVGVYARAIDILSQDVDSVLATPLDPTVRARLIPGIVDDRFEFNGGVSTGVKLTETSRLYLVYDTRLRDGFSAHAGTFGFEVRW